MKNPNSKYRQYDKKIQVDPENQHILDEPGWFVFGKFPHLYVIRNKKPKGAGQERLHRLIMQAGKGEVVDHINGNGLDNRKQNLRICTQKDNARNQRLNINNKSGYKGVRWRSDKKKWVARIKVNQKTIHLGYFTSKIKAAKIYDLAAIKAFGKFANLNFGENCE